MIRLRRSRALLLGSGTICVIAVAIVALTLHGRSAPAHVAIGKGETFGHLCYVPRAPLRTATAARGVHHYEFVVPDGQICVYDIDHGHRLVQAIGLPQAKGVRGLAVSAPLQLLYVSYGGDGGPNGDGSLLAWSFRTHRVVWTRSYGTGIDSMAVAPDGRTLWMPTGELNSGSRWLRLDAATGKQTGTVTGGAGPHNTIASADHVYLGTRDNPYLHVVDLRAGNRVTKIGPLKGGVRPFTVNHAQTLAFTTATGFLGFQVSSIRTGKVLYTVPLPGVSWNPDTFPATAPSHGITLVDHEREVWVMDAPNSRLHIFDVSGLPSHPPRQIATVALTSMTGQATPCAYDCSRDGWILHSANGRYVYVGDAGDVIDVSTRRVVAHLPALRNTRKYLEVDFRNGRMITSTSRSVVGG